jgi:pimeloyl-ACP methyl ester carboxylesterase
MAMIWQLDRQTSLDDGVVRWRSFGEQGHPLVLVHGTPYSSFVWRDIAIALSDDRRVIVFDHLGYGESEKREGQDLTIAAQARNFVRLLADWELDRPDVVACDIGGAIALRALLLEGAGYSSLTLFDAVTGGDWERGLFALIRQHHDVFEQLPDYAHRALVTSHLENGTFLGYKPGVLETYLAPWLGREGQAAFYRQYRQLSQRDTGDYEHLLGDIEIGVSLLWGREDRILPPEYGTWIEQRTPNTGITWVEHAGHLIPEDAPAQLLAHLRRTG